MVPPKNRLYDLDKKKLDFLINASDNLPPSFSFRFIVNHSNFNYNSLDKIHKIALIDTMFRLSQLNWAALRNSQYHGLGYEIIKRAELKFKLPSDVPIDKNIIAFRFFGKAPMIGYRDNSGVFYIIAFDSKFLAYNH